MNAKIQQVGKGIWKKYQYLHNITHKYYNKHLSNIYIIF